MGFKVVKGDLLDQKVDAIVVPSTPGLNISGGLGTRIAVITGKKIQKQIDKLDPDEMWRTFGTAVGPFNVENLPCKKAIFVINPKYPDEISNLSKDVQDELRACYVRALQLACNNNFKSIAFPLLSSGAYSFPKKMALSLAIDGINRFYKKTGSKIETYLVIKYASTYKTCRNTLKQNGIKIVPGGHLESERDEEFIRNVKKERGYYCDWYTDTIKKHFDNYGEPDEKYREEPTRREIFEARFDYYHMLVGPAFDESYKGVISRQAFEKILSGKSVPTRETMIALAVNMHLTPSQINELVMAIDEEDEFPLYEEDEIVHDAILMGGDLKTINKTLVDMGFKPLPTNNKTK